MAGPQRSKLSLCIIHLVVDYMSLAGLIIINVLY